MSFMDGMQVGRPMIWGDLFSDENILSGRATTAQIND